MKTISSNNAALPCHRSLLAWKHLKFKHGTQSVGPRDNYFQTNDDKKETLTKK